MVFKGGKMSNVYLLILSIQLTSSRTSVVRRVGPEDLRFQEKK